VVYYWSILICFHSIYSTLTFKKYQYLGMYADADEPVLKYYGKRWHEDVDTHTQYLMISPIKRIPISYTVQQQQKQQQQQQRHRQRLRRQQQQQQQLPSFEDLQQSMHPNITISPAFRDQPSPFPPSSLPSFFSPPPRPPQLSQSITQELEALRHSMQNSVSHIKYLEYYQNVYKKQYYDDLQKLQTLILAPPQTLTSTTTTTATTPAAPTQTITRAMTKKRQNDTSQEFISVQQSTKKPKLANTMFGEEGGELLAEERDESDDCEEGGEYQRGEYQEDGGGYLFYCGA